MSATPARPPRRSVVAASFGLAAAGIVMNGLLFAGYRLLFLHHHNVAAAPAVETGRVLLGGLRLDLALLGFELCGLGLITLLRRHLSLCWVARWLGGLTALHAFVCLANYFAFTERNQNAGDLLLPYITSPYQVYLAVLPFLQQHGILLVLGALVTVVGGGLALRWTRRLDEARGPVDLWRSPKTIALAALAALLPLMMTWQPVIKQKRKAVFSGLTAVFASSKYYTHFADYRANEAVINPLYEFVGVQIPTALHQNIRYRLTEQEALAHWENDNGGPGDTRYPLAEVIHGARGAQIENVVIIQVEGLSGSLLEQERAGKPVMPNLRRLARAGRYFPNTFQNANFTSGGVFSTASSVPKATWEEATRRFASHELRGYYGSLAHVLGGTNYTHYFCEGFRQSGDDFLAFMAYQGCTVLNYQAFSERLAAKGQLADADSVLGIHDGYLMQETAELLTHCPTRFTAHLMTCTTHSPWATPSSFKPRFDEPELNTFAYLDQSIGAFIERIEAAPTLREKTLFVIVGDHTSVTFGNNLLERLRIPLIFYGASLPSATENPGDTWASQVDVLPTVLGLMPGDHLYAGMGRNLLAAATPFTGIVSGTRDTGFYVTQDWVLQYHPFGGRPQLFAITNGMAAVEDLAATRPETVKQLLDECFARVELARRLSLDKRVYPPTARNLHFAAAGTRTTTWPDPAIQR